MKARTLEAITHGGDFELTEDDARRNAARLARDAVRTACKDSIVARMVDNLDDVPCTTISQEVYKVALLQLAEIASGAEQDDMDDAGVVVKRPNYPARLKALEILMNARHHEAEVLVKLQEVGIKMQQKSGAAGGQFVRARVVTAEQLRELEAKHRAESKGP